MRAVNYFILAVFCSLIVRIPVHAGDHYSTIETNLNSAMGSSNLGGLKAQDYMSYIRENSAVETITHPDGGVTVELKNIEIPTPAYVSILLASAEVHFQRCCRRNYFNSTEYQRGVTLVELAHWVAENKKDSFMLSGGILGSVPNLGSNMTPLDQAALAKLKLAMEKAKAGLTISDEAAALASVQGLVKDLDDAKQDLDRAFLEIQAKMQGDGLAKVNTQIESPPTQEPDTEACLSNPSTCGYTKQKILDKTDPSTWSADVNACYASDAESPLDPVILFSGQFILNATDLKVKGRGLELEVARHYRNQWERLGPMGFNWTHQYDEKIITDLKTGDQIHQMPNGMRFLFQKVSGENRFISPHGIFSTLTTNDSGYLLEDETRLKHFFNAQGRLTRLEDPYNNYLSFEYGLHGTSKVLVRVTDSLGQFIALRYNSQGLIETIRDSLDREIVYNYDAEKNLTSVRGPLTDEFPKGVISRYRYSGGLLSPTLNHNLIMIMDPKGQIYLRNRYGSEGLEKDRVIGQIFGEKNTNEMLVNYEALETQDTAINTAKSRTTVTDRKGRKHVYTHNSRGMRLAYDNESFTYNQDDLVTGQIDKTGLVETFTFDETNKNRLGQKNLLTHSIKSKTQAGLVTTYQYDPNYQHILAKTVTGENDARSEKYSYSETGLLNSFQRGDIVTTFQYNQFGQKIKETQGPWTRSYQYEGAQVTKITDQAGTETRSLQLAYDLYGNVNRIIDPAGFETKFWFNAINQLLQKQSALGYKTYYSYDANNNQTEVIYENKGGFNVETIGYQLAERFTYDTLDHLTEKTIQINREQWAKESFAYDPNENLIRHTNISNVTKELVYNNQDQIIAEKINGEAWRYLTYDGAGRLSAETDALNHQKTYTWDDWSQVSHLTDANGSRLHLSYSDFGQVAGMKFFSAEDKLMKEVTFAYDVLGQQKNISERKVGTEEWLSKNIQYEGNQLKTISDDVGLLQSFVFNGFGQITEVRDAVQNTLSISYDARGLMTQKIIAKGTNRIEENFAYDALGRPSDSIYDSLGNLVKSIDPMNHETLFTYDGLGRLLSEQTGERIRKLEWNEQGHIAKFIDGINQETSFTYSAQGRKQTETTPDGVVKQYTYNALGQMTALQMGGKIFSYSYDPTNHLTQRRADSGEVQKYNYDGLGRMIASVDSNDPNNADDDVRVEFAYDSLNHLLKEMSHGYTLQKNYNQRGQNTQTVYPAGDVIQNTYDAAGWLKEIVANGQTLGSLDYALMGLQKTETLGNGVLHRLDYNNLMQLAGESHLNQTKKLSALQYQYDPAGRVVLREDSIDRLRQSFAYNELDQLSKAGKREYAYDFEGQWKEVLGKEITSGPDYQYTQFNGQNLSYDPSGNLTGYGEKLFEYDAWNRLVRVRDKASNNLIASYTYDAHNRRVTKQTPALRTQFTYDGWKLIEEYEGKIPTRTYYHTQSLDQPLALKTNNESYFYHRDRLGSIIALSNQKREIVESYRYDEFGNLLGTNPIKSSTQNPPLPRREGAGGRVHNPLTYTAQYFDEESGLYYYKNRYYSANLGRFLTKDPKGMIDGPNLYAYVGNDPMNWIDPMGTEKAQSRNWIDNTMETVTYAQGYLDKWSPLSPIFRWLSEDVLGQSYVTPGYEDVYQEGRARAKSHQTPTALLNTGQTVLDVAGLVPFFGEPADGLNALIYTARGDPVNAALSTAALLPIGGQAATGAKLTLKAGAVKLGAKHTDELKLLPAPKEIKLLPAPKLDLGSLTPGQAQIIENFANKFGNLGKAGKNGAIKPPKGPPKPSPKFKPPTNPAQLPPADLLKNAPPGTRLFRGKPTEQYPDGYWKIEKPNGLGWQKLDPRTMKPGPRPDTHVEFPKGYKGPFDN